MLLVMGSMHDIPYINSSNFSTAQFKNSENSKNSPASKSECNLLPKVREHMNLLLIMV